ncbi:agmatine deiminase family protein [Streptomyces sp. NK15101]|uniref:agmatine deiminase family protein n=1 Tax=Streptomyces sp. NK15101 TaxID=2873261 RepID=UPI001CEC99A9|nr:agmatine deiminase family protein [Streptomyces sp. NK15101]
MNRRGFLVTVGATAVGDFHLCNGAVISARFGDRRANEAARTTLRRLYPDRYVEQLDIDRLGTGGGQPTPTPSTVVDVVTAADARLLRSRAEPERPAALAEIFVNSPFKLLTEI